MIAVAGANALVVAFGGDFERGGQEAGATRKLFRRVTRDYSGIQGTFSKHARDDRGAVGAVPIDEQRILRGLPGS